MFVLENCAHHQDSFPFDGVVRDPVRVLTLLA
jgi:hypothetical protein